MEEKGKEIFGCPTAPITSLLFLHNCLLLLRERSTFANFAEPIKLIDALRH
jgi:hypothetical protein